MNGEVVLVGVESDVLANVENNILCNEPKIGFRCNTLYVIVEPAPVDDANGGGADSWWKPRRGGRSVDAAENIRLIVIIGRLLSNNEFIIVFRFFPPERRQHQRSDRRWFSGLYISVPYTTYSFRYRHIYLRILKYNTVIFCWRSRARQPAPQFATESHFQRSGSKQQHHHAVCRCSISWAQARGMDDDDDDAS